MATIRSDFSFEQFEEVLQKMAHKVALEAVKTLKHGDVRITIYGSRFSHVETDEYGFSFYAKHATCHKSDPDGFAFDVAEKFYLTSNAHSKISFEVWPKEDTEKVQKRIMAFIDKIMAEASIKPIPRFTLGNIKAR
jgi:small-conductance mechanosensitive channel